MAETVEITALAHGGDGIGRIEGQVCFVPYGLPGDTLEVSVVRKTKNALWAKIEAVVIPSPHRRETQCPYFERCGGCSWLHFAYPAQAEWKRRIAADALDRIGGVKVRLDWVENENQRQGYRTRATFHGDGAKVGFYAPGSHDIVDIAACPLCHPKMNAALARLRETGPKGPATLTVNPQGGDVLVWTKFARRKLKQYFPLAQTPKDEKARAQFRFDGAPVVNGAFSQSSLLLNRLLVRTTHEMIGEAASVLDLYCGSGNLSLGLPGSIEVSGMDHNKAGVHAANRLRPGAYRVGGETKMRKLLAKGEQATVLLDPPRAGAKALLPALCESTARAIVYVSCDAATLARDLKALAAAGWKVERAAAMDLFPNTPHVEVVCRLVK